MGQLHLTERDQAILVFINDFGFCEMPELEQRFGFKKPRSYQVLNRLVEARLLSHERVFHGRHGIFRLTRAGAKFTTLPPLYRLPLATYQHDLTLLRVYLALRLQYPTAQWISERRLRQEKHLDGVGVRGHIADGLLVLADGKRIAIEVELTLKAKPRLERILRGYSGQFGIEAVWYYCPASVLAAMRPLMASWNFIELVALQDVLA